MNKFQTVKTALKLMTAICALAVSTGAQANLISVTSPFGPPNVTFSGLPSAAPLNGLAINGFTFSETISNTFVRVGGPGNTNDITQPSALGNANPAGEIITVAMPSMTSEFGFGYAILAGGVVPNAVTISLFNNATDLGSLSYTGSPDPTFPGGFAGIESSNAFNIAEITFNPKAAAYDFDNITAIKAIPEPVTLSIFGTGLAAALATRRRKQKTA